MERSGIERPESGGTSILSSRIEAAEMVVETSRPIAHVIRELNMNETMIGNRVKENRETYADDEPTLRVSERARIAS